MAFQKSIKNNYLNQNDIITLVYLAFKDPIKRTIIFAKPSDNAIIIQRSTRLVWYSGVLMINSRPEHQTELVVLLTILTSIPDY